METYYALTSSGLDRLENGLDEGPLSAVLGALIDLEERQPDMPHTLAEMQTMNPHIQIAAVSRALSMGYVEIVKRGDERFPSFN